MKKLVLFFIFIFALIGFNVYAEEVRPDESSEYDEYFYYLEANKIFNNLIVSNDEIASIHYEHYNKYVYYYYLSYNNLTVTTNIKFYDLNDNLIEESVFKICYIMDYDYVDSIKIYIGDNLIFNLSMMVRTVIYDTPCYDISSYLDNASYAIIGEYNYTFDKSCPSYCYQEFVPIFLYSTMIIELESDTVSVDINNPLNTEDIATKSGMKDKLGNVIADYEIIDGDYDKDNIEIKDYYIRLRAYLSGWVYFKTININITDNNTLIVAPNIIASYDKKLTIYDILDYVDIGFQYKSFNVNSDYFYSFDKIGDYNYVIYFTDLNDQTYYATGVISVKDLIPPLVDKDIIIVNGNTPIEKNDILNQINVHDEYDGSIEDVQLNGYIEYLKNYNVEGEYVIYVIAYDDSLNELNQKIIIQVSTSDIIRNPINSIEIYEQIEETIKEETIDDEIITEKKDTTIIYSDYIINTYTDHKLSMSEIQDLLISEGLLLNDDIVTFSGTYFELESPDSGQYEILLSYASGKRVYYEILNNVRENDTVEEDNDNTSTIMYVICGIVGAGIVVILIIRRKTNAKRS